MVRQALAPRKRGRKSQRNSLEEENQKLSPAGRPIYGKLRKAETIMEVQKKVAALLGNPISYVDPEEKS